jgi:hypothetical protein
MNLNWQWTHHTGGCSENFLFFRGWRIGWNEGRSVSSKNMRNYPKLSWKSTTCDTWPALPIDLNRNAGGFATASFALDLVPKMSMNNPLTALYITTIPHIMGIATVVIINCCADEPKTSQGLVPPVTRHPQFFGGVSSCETPIFPPLWSPNCSLALR